MPVPHLNISALKAFKLLFYIVLACVVGVFVYLPNYAKLRTLRQANTEMKDKVSDLQIEIRDLTEKMHRIKRDPHFYEQIARDDLGVAREDEIVVDIEE